MRILFDQAVPVPLRPYLEGHTIRTAAQQGLRYQQNPAGRKIAIVVLGQQQWPLLRPHVQYVIDSVNAAVPGSYAEVWIPYRQ